jgi:hypothetical protein
MKISITILLVLVILAPTMTRGAYNVAVGNTFSYEAVKINWDIQLGTDSSSGTGFSIDETHYTDKSQFTVEVTAADSVHVDWDLVIGTDTIAGTNFALDGLYFVFALFMPLFYSLPSTWNQTAMDLGPELVPIFFVDISGMSDFFYELSNDTYVSTAFSDPEWLITNIGGTFDNSTNIAVFEWHFDMTWTDAVSGHNYGGTFTFIFAFDKTTGQMKGFYQDLNYSGQVDFTVQNVKFTQRFEEVGYNLPGVGFIPGFEWFIVIPALALLAGIPIIIKRRK